MPEEPDVSPAPCRKAAPLVFTADGRSGEAAAELRWGGNAAEGRPAAVAAAACLSRTCADGEAPGSAAQRGAEEVFQG